MKKNIYLLSNLLFEQEEYKRAVEEYEKLLQCENINVFFVNTMLAVCYREIGNPMDSYQCALKCKEMQPKHELSSLSLYLALIDLKKYKEAIQELYSFADKNPINMYKDTIVELLEDMKEGNAINYKNEIIFLCKKHNINTEFFF